MSSNKKEHVKFLSTTMKNNIKGDYVLNFAVCTVYEVLKTDLLQRTPTNRRNVHKIKLAYTSKLDLGALSSSQMAYAVLN